MGGQSSKDNDALTDMLVKRGSITKREVEMAFRLTDRGRFLPPENRADAYRQSPMKITSSEPTGQFYPGPLHISAPEIYGIVMCELDLGEGMTFLNIGSGSGWLNTAVGFILGDTGVNVGVETFENMVKYAEKRTLETVAMPHVQAFPWCRPQYNCCNALTAEFLDNPDDLESYDRIYCGAAVANPRHIDKLLRKLVIGGKMVVPIEPELQKYTRISETRCIRVPLSRTTYAPLAPPVDNYTNQTLPSTAKHFPTLKSLCRVTIRRQLRSRINVDGCEPQVRQIFETGETQTSVRGGPSTSNQQETGNTQYELFRNERHIERMERHLMEMQRFNDQDFEEEEVIERLHRRVADFMEPFNDRHDEAGQNRHAMMLELGRHMTERLRDERRLFMNNGRGGEEEAEGAGAAAGANEMMEIIDQPMERRRQLPRIRIIDSASDDSSSDDETTLRGRLEVEAGFADRMRFIQELRRTQRDEERVRRMERRERRERREQQAAAAAANRGPHVFFDENGEPNRDVRVVGNPRGGRVTRSMTTRDINGVEQVVEQEQVELNEETDTSEDEEEEIRNESDDNEEIVLEAQPGVVIGLSFANRRHEGDGENNVLLREWRTDGDGPIRERINRRRNVTNATTSQDQAASSSSSNTHLPFQIPLEPIGFPQDPRESRYLERMDRKRKHDKKKEDRVKRQKLEQDEFKRFQRIYNESIGALNLPKNLKNYVRDLLHFCV